MKCIKFLRDTLRWNPFPNLKKKEKVMYFVESIR